MSRFKFKRRAARKAAAASQTPVVSETLAASDPAVMAPEMTAPKMPTPETAALEKAAPEKAGPEKAGPEKAGQRKPRLLIAGEFSAGKTHLINGLVGHTVLPSNVTATALPPVWLVGGATEALAQVDLEKTIRKIDTLADATIGETHFCLRATAAPVLDRYDLIDTPGNSDPNIPAESWERMLGFADSVVWCTNATQAWRQSEKSVWDEMPAHLVGKATLLITHADRIIDARSAERVLRRVKREAGKYFASFLMVSLIKPADIATIAQHLDGVVSGLETLEGQTSIRVTGFRGDLSSYAMPAAVEHVSEETGEQTGEEAGEQAAFVEDAAPIVPRRVTRDSPAPEPTIEPVTEPVPAPAADSATVIASQPTEKPEAAPASFAPEAYDADPGNAATATSIRALMGTVPGNAKSADPAAAKPQTAIDRSAEVITLVAAGAAKIAPQDSLILDSLRADISEPVATGRARALWDEMRRTVDTQDPAALLRCVDRLVAALDDPATASGARLTHTADADAEAQIALNMTRRTS